LIKIKIFYQILKTKYKIIGLVSFFIFIISCQKKSDPIEYKNKVIVLLKNLETSGSEDSIKERTLDTLSQFLLAKDSDSISRNLIFKVANQYYYINRSDKYLKLAHKLLELSIKKNDTSHIAKSLCYIGDYHNAKSQFDSAFIYYNKSEKLYKTQNDTLMLGTLSLLKGGVLFDSGNFSESETETIKALKLLSKAKSIDLVHNCYNVIAISLKQLNNCEKSLDYFDLALKQLDKLEKENYPKEKIIKNRVSCYNNIGRVYEKMKNYEMAIQFYNKGIQTKNLKEDYPKSYALLIDNLGYSKLKAGNYKGIDTLFFESLRIRDSLDIKNGVVSCKINIGEYYLYKKDTAKALAFIKEGLVLSKQINSSSQSIQSLKLLMENDSKNKAFYTNQYLNINDSIQEVERTTRNKFARIAYETNQIEEKNETLSKWNNNIIIGSAIIIILFGGFFVIYRLKSKNKELLLIKEQQEANEKIYQLMLNQQSETETARNHERNRIAMELHDGIVNSIFTTRFNLIQLNPNQTEKKEELVKELENAENEIRRVSHDLQQNLLFEDTNLPEIIKDLVAAQKNEFNTQFDVSVDKYIDWSKISSNDKIHIYRIIQEAIQNINKYSKAEKGFIFLLKTGAKITIRIWDNGIGFNLEKVKRGIGLKNIQQRTKLLHGEFKITSSSANGTNIEIIF
jgi:signal transduction histidine kinase